MEIVLKIIKDYGSTLSAVCASFAFIVGIYKFQMERKAAQFWQEFEAYHKLVKELVQPFDDSGTMYVDRQTAVLFELRFYKRYYEHSLRMIIGLLEKWRQVPNQFPRILEEADLTIAYIQNNCKRKNNIRYI